MADICACKGDNCPLKKKCYRYTCPKGQWQYYFDEPPYDSDKKDCDYFINKESE